jgi:Uncharacterised MFS-type transporter YbfB
VLPAFVGVLVADGGRWVAGSGTTGWEDGALVGDPERPADVGGRGKETIAWLVAPGLALIAVTYGLARFAYGLFLPDMREAFDLSPSLLGLIGAGSYLGYCVAVIISLVYTSRTGPRLMAVGAGAVAVAGMAVVAGSPVA